MRVASLGAGWLASCMIGDNMSLRHVRAGLAALAPLLVVAACSSTPSVTAPPSVTAASLAPGSLEASPSATGSQTSAFDLEIGDCFDAEDITTVDEVTVIECEASHVYEVFGVTDYDAGPDDPYPGEEPLNDAADEACRPAFEDYVGVSYDESEWFATFINPSEGTWAAGDREILCVLHEETPPGPDGTELPPPAVTGSAQGSER